jgi:hypothetical protein
VSVPSKFERDVQGKKEYGIVTGDRNGVRFCSPYRAGRVAPFVITKDAERTKLDALAAANELREYLEKNP